MEDIPRDVQKELESYKAPKKTRKTGHWTLLFVGDEGEVITIRKFKGLMLLAVFILVVALSATASIYMLYKKPFEENRRLEAALAEAARQVRDLGEERDLLLTRLGITESRLKKTQAPEPATAPADQVTLETPLPASEEKPPAAEVATVPESGTVRMQPAPPAKPEAPLPPVTASEIKPEVKIDVRDFQVLHEPEQKLLKVQFRLKNVNVEVGAVSGRTFVFLANDQDDETDILTFPKVRIVDDKPGRIHPGRYFSISRFNIVKFERAYKESPRPFNSATVFVYSGAGDLLLEKRFSIENPFKETAPTVPETNETQPGGAGKPYNGQEGFKPNNTILNN
jgi:hypothetical protein